MFILEVYIKKHSILKQPQQFWENQQSLLEFKKYWKTKTIKESRYQCRKEGTLRSTTLTQDCRAGGLLRVEHTVWEGKSPVGPHLDGKSGFGESNRNYWEKVVFFGIMEKSLWAFTVERILSINGDIRRMRREIYHYHLNTGQQEVPSKPVLHQH